MAEPLCALPYVAGGFVMLPPLITSAVAHGESNALKDMADHLTITHKSKRLVAAARLYARVMMQGQQPFFVLGY